jgi:thioredoxin-dependent peroxiredoxin
MHLQIGDKAPAFAAKDQNENIIQLSDFEGKRVILYFYPKDDTPSCTAQACSLRDNHQALVEQGYVVLGVSIDNEKKHRKFIEKYNLPFSLLADTDQMLVDAYGVWAEKSMYGRTYMGTVRTTFIIDPQGVIEDIVTKIDTKNHATQLLTTNNH